MSDQYYEVKDSCRRNLSPFTLDAFSSIPRIDRPLILDLGCGTGETTMALLGVCNGNAYAVDMDEKSLAFFRQKAERQELMHRVRIINDSVLNAEQLGIQFDLIIAEGILNVVGFETGLKIIVRLLKQGGHAMIHDEVHKDSEKRIIFEEYHLKLLNSFELDETVWWNKYYACLEKSIESLADKELFQNEMMEIREYRKNPEKFRSIYYILEKQDKVSR